MYSLSEGILQKSVGKRHCHYERLEKTFNLSTFHLISGKHLQVVAMMRAEKVHIEHRFDPWHLAKSVRKNLATASKKRECGDLLPWTASVVNHLWWCTATSTALKGEMAISRSPRGRHTRIA